MNYSKLDITLDFGLIMGGVLQYIIAFRLMKAAIYGV